MVIEVFKTDVTDQDLATTVKDMLLHHFPGTRVNFDLHDCDNILRVEGTGFTASHVQRVVREAGINCSVLD